MRHTPDNKFPQRPTSAGCLVYVSPLEERVTTRESCDNSVASREEAGRGKKEAGRDTQQRHDQIVWLSCPFDSFLTTTSSRTHPPQAHPTMGACILPLILCSILGLLAVGKVRIGRPELATWQSSARRLTSLFDRFFKLQPEPRFAILSKE